MSSPQDMLGLQDRSAHWLRFDKDSWPHRTRDSEHIANIRRIVELAYDILRSKIAGGIIGVDNEASLQLHLSAILQTLGPLFEFDTRDRFVIELEGWLPLTADDREDQNDARVDILLSLGDESRFSTCAIELKYFKRANGREPHSRYDVFTDLSRLENYRQRLVDVAYFIAGTDNPHYVTHVEYGAAARDFDLREGAQYAAGTTLTYNTRSGETRPQITLTGNYTFEWDTMARRYPIGDQLWFLRVDV